MTTTNHTDITTGAAANASTINAPLGQLDAAIGDLSALTTTDKASVKAAINEVDLHADNVQTQINVQHQADGDHKPGVIDNDHLATDIKVGSLAAFPTSDKGSVQAAMTELYNRVAGSIDADGTLKSGSVDGTAVIANSVVTNDKLATDIKVGSLAALTTTEKNSAVGAINEIDANADAAQTEITNARLGSSDLREQMYRTNQVYGSGGLHLLQQWRTKIAFIQNQEVGADAVLGFAGDDWVELNDDGNSYMNILSTYLHTEYGNGGAGWVSFAAPDTSHRPAGVDITKTGTFEDTVNNKIVGPSTDNPSIGPCLRHTRIVTIDSPTAQTITVTSQADAFIIHYYKRPGGGDFHYKLNDAAWVDVTTDATAAYAVETVASGGGSVTLTIEPTIAGSQGIILVGVDIQFSQVGVRVHNLGSVGATSADWAECDLASFKAAISYLGLDVFAMQIGMNEFDADLGDVATDQETLITQITTQLPRCDIVLIPNGDNGTDGPTLTGAYSTAMSKTAWANGAVFFPLWDYLGLYSANRGIYSSTTLLNYLGQRVEANLMFHHIFKVD